MFWCIPHFQNSTPPASLVRIPVSHLLQLTSFASILDCLYHLLEFCRRAFNVSRVLVAGLKANKAESFQERQELHSHALQILSTGKRKNCPSQQLFENTLSVVKGRSIAGALVETFTPLYLSRVTEYGNVILASLILQNYG